MKLWRFLHPQKLYFASSGAKFSSPLFAQEEWRSDFFPQGVPFSHLNLPNSKANFCCSMACLHTSTTCCSSSTVSVPGEQFGAVRRVAVTLDKLLQIFLRPARRLTRLDELNRNRTTW